MRPSGPPPASGQEHFFADTCLAIQLFAVRHELPIGYSPRLIWQESNFDPNAPSIAGAQGIAQFMPSSRPAAAA